jgi:hypothetical protein
MTYIGLQNPDNKTLFSGTVTTTGAGATIDVSGFSTLLVQVSGSTFNGIITFERSLDNVYWSPALVTELNALNEKTQIETAGLYFVRTEAQYLRYNVTNISGSATLVIDGTQSVVSNADKVAWAMDETNNTPLNVKLQFQNSGIKQDLSGAFILSDAPAPVTVNQAIGSTTTIDTQGYQSIQITTNATFAAGLGVTYSNDNLTFIINTPLLTGSGTVNTGLAASQTYVSPCYGRFARIVATAAGSFTYVLRNYSSLVAQNLAGINGAAVNSAIAQLGVNMQQVGGVTTVTGGLAGTLGVGGSGAVGAIPLTSPIIAGGIDPAGLTRRLASDTLGSLFVSARVIPTNLAALGGTTQAPVPVSLAGYNNQVPLAVQDTSQFEGQTQIELLAQMLQELKILNQQIYELPRILAGQLNGINTAGNLPMFTYGDEPTAMRNDASLFDKQQ